jgi:Zn-dependent peptidase ImmA (M78 family)/transcriptional regulator with XRE-family HTH domain
MFAERLRLARKKAGLSLQALAARLSPPVSAQAISKYESGRMMPSSAVLVGLGKALGVSLDFLLGGQVSELSSVEFRKGSRTSAQDRAHTEALVIERLEGYLAIEDILGIEADADAFAGVRRDAIASMEEVEGLALDLRAHWQLGTDPLPSLTRLLEEKGVRVIEADLPERFDGLACSAKRASGRPSVEVIVVSSRTTLERKRFSLAHELAHRVIASVRDPEVLRLERAMDRFAAAFLAPAVHLKGEVGENRHGVTYHEVIRLKRLYGISAAAMLIRLRDVGLLPREAVEGAFRSYARGWRSQEPVPLDPGDGFGAFEHPQRFEQLVYRALAEDLIALPRAAQLLGLPLAKVEEEVRGPRA